MYMKELLILSLLILVSACGSDGEEVPDCQDNYYYSSTWEQCLPSNGSVQLSRRCTYKNVSTGAVHCGLYSSRSDCSERCEDDARYENCTYSSSIGTCD